MLYYTSSTFDFSKKHIYHGTVYYENNQIQSHSPQDFMAMICSVKLYASIKDFTHIVVLYCKIFCTLHLNHCNQYELTPTLCLNQLNFPQANLWYFCSRLKSDVIPVGYQKASHIEVKVIML